MYNSPICSAYKEHVQYENEMVLGVALASLLGQLLSLGYNKLENLSTQFMNSL